MKNSPSESKRFTILPIAALILTILSSKTFGQTVSTCAQYQRVNTTTSPAYYVQTNFWNPGCNSSPTTQCMVIDPATGDFAVTAGTFTCGDNVTNYPSIVYGCQGAGSCSTSSNLPMPVSMLQCVTSSWTIGVTNQTGGDLWDAAYDIWFDVSNSNYSHTAELMIWLNYEPGTGPGGSFKASGVSIGNSPTLWNVYEGPVGWNYIAFLANTPVTVFNDVDLLAFVNYCVTQGYIQSGWSLGAVEAGIEMRTGGVPFTSSGFNVSVNTANCGTPTITPTPTVTYSPTPTPTSTPCGFPGPICTPTDTPIPTATPSSQLLPFPNPWPNAQAPGDTVSFYYQNDQTIDQAQVKIFTTAYRKIYEDDGLPTAQGGQAGTVNLANLNLANGLYYIVLVQKTGGNATQKVMKLLIQR